MGKLGKPRSSAYPAAGFRAAIGSHPRWNWATRCGIVIAILAYTVLFYSCEWQPLAEAFQRPVRRFEIFPLVLVPEQLAPQWAGFQGEIAFFDRLPVLGTALLIVLAAFAVGRFVLRTVGYTNNLPSVIQIPLATLIGLGISSHYVLLIGLARWLQHRWLIWLWVSIPLFFLVFRICFLTKAKAKGARQLFAEALTLGRKDSANGQHTALLLVQLDRILLAAGCVLFATVIILGAVLPPTDFDVREYHLQAPKEFFQAGEITFLPHNVYANMPLGAEMHALAGMMFTGDVWTGALAGKTVVGLYALLGAWLIAGFAAQLVGPTAGFAAALTFLSTPWIVSVSTAGLVDVALGVMIFAGFVTTFPASLGQLDPREGDGAKRGGKLRAQQVGWGEPPIVGGKGTGWGNFGPQSFLVGLVVGMAATIKYTGLLYALAPLAGLVVHAVVKQRADRRAKVLSAASFIAGLCLGGGGWYLKNLLFTGNPIYPLAYSIFDGLNWDAAKAARWHRVHSPPDFSGDAFVKDLLRITLTSDWHSGVIIPLALAGVVKLRKGAIPTGMIGLIIWIYGTWWCFTHRIDRFWLPALPFLSIFCGAGFVTLRERGLGWLARTLVALALLWNALVIMSGAAAYNRFLAPFQQLWTDPERIGRDHILLNDLFRELPEDARLLAVGEAAVFDLRRPVLYATCFDDPPWEVLTRGKSPDEIRETLKAHNVVYVYVNWLEIARYRLPGNYGFSDYVTPQQFRDLVNAGVLVPALMPADSPNQLFLVP